MSDAHTTLTRLRWEVEERRARIGDTEEAAHDFHVAELEFKVRGK